MSGATKTVGREGVPVFVWSVPDEKLYRPLQLPPEKPEGTLWELSDLRYPFMVNKTTMI